MHPEPIDVLDEEWGRRCDHDDCATLAEYHCACLCGRVLCELHERLERRSFQVRQGLSIIQHQADAAQIKARREASPDEERYRKVRQRVEATSV